MTARATITAAPVGFPRAKPEHDAGYYAEFRRDAAAHMRAWLGYALAEFFDLYTPSRENVDELEHDAWIVAEELATREIARKLRRAETTLITEALRDLLTAKLVTRDLECVRQAELSRKVL